MRPHRTPFHALGRLWLLALLLALALPAQALDTAHLSAQLERLREAAHAPGATAAVMVGGELVWSAGVGVADAENAVPMRGDAVHNIGSVSKVVGAIALMQLVERGRIDLDAEIQTYAPWFPRKQAPITVRQILTHTSGIRHYRDGEFGEGDVLRFQQFDGIEAASRRWMHEPLLFDPGRHWNYSTFATNLLQAAIEQASGQDMETYMRERLWAPAGMADTQFDVPARIVPRRARGYEWDAGSGVLSNAVQENVSYKYVGGGILSSDEDMVRMAHALNTGRLLGAEAIAEMYRPQLDASVTLLPPPPGKPASRDAVPVQGLIWRVQEDADGRRYVAHSGSVKGTLSYLANWPQHDVAVALHVNARGGEADLRAAAEALAARFLPAPARD
ncbi:serine hydrolase domain-containing protein [Luteimonas huabeiensis]|uniref:serine hydrolase domain-containing protein n=1 Tax=Luteimonas huabeiensis TaxID=1244513 RepID=UPI000467A390|nr:serine hydrolase domain-containing protein [Luteimonas huabeiensis]